MPVTIEFDAKFTSKDLTGIITQYWHRSLTEKDVVFNLKKIEWISLEELTFLFGWFRHVKFNNKNLVSLKVNLPSLTQSEQETFRSQKQKEDTIRRRRTRLISLYDNVSFPKVGPIKNR